MPASGRGDAERNGCGRSIRPIGHTSSRNADASLSTGEIGPKLGGRGRRLTFHGLRKYTATALIESGTDLGVVQRVMRHSDIRLTMRCYNDVLDSRLGEAVDRLPAIAPGRE